MRKTLLISVVIILGCTSANAITIDFDFLPDGTTVSNGTVITTQYFAAYGVTFSSVYGGPIAANGYSPASVLPGQASSEPNCLLGNPNSFTPILMDFASSVYTLDVNLISVGDAVVTASAYGDDFMTLLDSVSVTNKGTGVGMGIVDTVTLGSDSGIYRVLFEITTPYPGDGFGIDDVVFQSSSPAVPEPGTIILLGAGLGIFCCYRRKPKTENRKPKAGKIFNRNYL